ncbi:MAG: hypothetical protein QOC84_164 [Bradyrhizobium sp.]|jgi:hypothetical protein|nr:hypothetical protein [Bradyrhizobium sp.]
MACGEVEQFEITSWHWCWTWHGPWLCKETRIVRLFVYDFAVLRKRIRWFSANYQACCEFAAGEFRWSESSWGIYQNPPNEYGVRRTFDHQLIAVGKCSLA